MQILKSWHLMLTKNKLISELKKETDEVLDSPEERYAYSQDASNFRRVENIADAVVFVKNAEQIQKVVRIASKYNVPIICRGAGTNVVGACKIEHGGIVLNFSRMNKIIEISPENMTATVQPGVILGELQKEAEKFGLFYPPDPSNLSVSTIGGSIAQNSGGAKSFKYGTTADYVLDLKVVNSDGEVIEFGSKTAKNSTGYNLAKLFVGSEGTLGIIAEATLKLIPKPECKNIITAYFETVRDAILAVNSIIEHKIFPCSIDFMDKNAVQTIEKYYPANLLTDKEAMLLIEIDGLKCSMKYQKEVIESILKSCKASAIAISHNEEEYEKILRSRRSSMASCTKIKPNVTTDDVIVPRENLEKLVLGIQTICKKYSLECCMIGHVGDGSIHPQIPIDYSDEDEYRRYKKAKSEIYDLTSELGGILSGEHGIGSEKRKFIGKVVNSSALDYMRQIKKIFDPKNIFNPYKIF